MLSCLSGKPMSPHRAFPDTLVVVDEAFKKRLHSTEAGAEKVAEAVGGAVRLELDHRLRLEPPIAVTLVVELRLGYQQTLAGSGVVVAPP